MDEEAGDFEEEDEAGGEAGVRGEVAAPVEAPVVLNLAATKNIIVKR